MTAEIFDVDHEPTPRAVSWAMTDPVFKLNVCHSSAFLILCFVYLFVLVFPLGRQDKNSVSVNHWRISFPIRTILRIFSVTWSSGHILLVLLDICCCSLYALVMWKSILGGPRSCLCVVVQEVFCSLSCCRICLQLIDQIKYPPLIPMPFPNCCFSWNSASSLVYYNASRYEMQGQKSRKEFLG